ncbi:MAG: HAD family hydrolase [Cypionkella sp.]|nr:HAD family hydrolase [Cypionkella sp.]
MITTIGIDADDTLWHNETFFRLTQVRFADLMAPFAPAETLQAQLLAAERRNLGDYGYGIKGFTLSMIETAIQVSKGTVTAPVIAEILAAGREMLAHPIDLLPHVHETVAQLAQSYRVIMITKGDLLDQERKLAQSGLGDLFHGVEIVSEKTPQIYSQIAQKHGVRVQDMVMVGNSLKSDVLPMIAAGGYGVHVPHSETWALEHAEPPADTSRYASIKTLAELPHIVGQIKSAHNL